MTNRASRDFSGWCEVCKHHHSWHRIGSEPGEAQIQASLHHYTQPYCRGLRVPDRDNQEHTNRLNRGYDSQCECTGYVDEGYEGYR